MSTSYEFHELCLLFPQADDAIIAQMAADVRENGLAEPIVLHEGKILDGRNRYLACQMACVEPTFKEYVGAEPLLFVVSKNLHRRHLSDAQRAMMAQKIWKMNKNMTQTQIQQTFDVSPSAVRKAARVSEEAIDEVKKKVEAGALSLNKATKVVRNARKAVCVGVCDVVPEERKQAYEDMQKKILEAGVPDEDYSYIPKEGEVRFGKDVIQGVYDGSLYRKNIQKIQTIIADMETLPGLFDEVRGLVETVEKNKLLVACCDMVLSAAKHFAKQIQSGTLSYDDVLSELADLMNCRFKLPCVEKGGEADLLDSLISRCESDVATLMRDVAEIRKKAKATKGISD